MVVYNGFGSDQGTCTTENIVILDADDRLFFNRQFFEILMTWFGTGFSSGSPRSMMDLGDRQLKRIVHFKLFVAVEGLSQTIEKGIQADSSFSPFTGA